MATGFGRRVSIIALIALTGGVVLLTSALSALAGGPSCGGPFQPSCPPKTVCGAPGLPACPPPPPPPYPPPLSGPVSDTYYNTSAGDNIVRLINPLGIEPPLATESANTCAMIYVFNNDEEMVSCCGCSLSPQKLLSLSVENNLTSNALTSQVGSNRPPSIGILNIVSVLPNAPLPSNPLRNNPPSNGQGCPKVQSAACNGGCDPTESPGYQVSTNFSFQNTELNGYIVHNTLLPGYLDTLPEVPFANTGSDPETMAFLENLCGAIVADNQNGVGICNCGN